MATTDTVIFKYILNTTMFNKCLKLWTIPRNSNPWNFIRLIAVLKVPSIKKCLALSNGVMSAHNDHLLLVWPSKEIVIIYSSPKVSISIQTENKREAALIFPSSISDVATLRICSLHAGRVLGSPWRTSHLVPAAVPRRSHGGNSWLSLGLGFRPGLPGLIEP